MCNKGNLASTNRRQCVIHGSEVQALQVRYIAGDVN